MIAFIATLDTPMRNPELFDFCWSVPTINLLHRCYCASNFCIAALQLTSCLFVISYLVIMVFIVIDRA